jgi:peptidoglycan/LPS O-acetylase OafA/YrhL
MDDTVPHTSVSGECSRISKPSENGVAVTKYRYIDSLRGYAILGVLAVHSWVFADIRPTTGMSYVFFSCGSRGVQLFFLISTITLFFSYKARQHAEHFTAANFFIRRFFRIAPMYWVGIVLYNVIVARHSIPLVPSIFFIFGFSPETINTVFPGSWSVAVEWCFYFALPLLFVSIRNVLSAMLLLLGTTLLAHYTYGLYASHYFPFVDKDAVSNFNFLWIGNQAPVFALGILLYMVIKGRAVGRHRVFGALAVIVGAGIVVCACPVSDGYYLISERFVSLLRFLHPYMPACIGLAILVFGTFWLNDNIWSNRLCAALGKVSYSLYVLNWFVISTCHSWLPKPVNVWVLFPVSVLVGGGLSWITYNTVEKPGIAMGQWLAGKLEEYWVNRKNSCT